MILAIDNQHKAYALINGTNITYDAIKKAGLQSPDTCIVTPDVNVDIDKSSMVAIGTFSNKEMQVPIHRLQNLRYTCIRV